MDMLMMHENGSGVRENQERTSRRVEEGSYIESTYRVNTTISGIIAYASRQSTQLPRTLSTDNVLKPAEAIAHDERPISPGKRGVL